MFNQSTTLHNFAKSSQKSPAWEAHHPRIYENLSNNFLDVKEKSITSKGFGIRHLNLEVFFWDIIFKVIHILQTTRRAMIAGARNKVLMLLSYLVAMAGLSLGYVLSLFTR